MVSLDRLHIQGYRPFGDFQASLGRLEVLVGANGSGKSSLFEFLRFLRDSMAGDIPPEIVAGGIGRQLFHRPGPDKFSWALDLTLPETLPPMRYEATLLGPAGDPKITQEMIRTIPTNGAAPLELLSFGLQEGWIADRPSSPQAESLTKRPNQLALAALVTSANPNLHALREMIRDWRFFNAGQIDLERLRKSALVEQQPSLREDAGNLSSVLHYLMSEHPTLFDELQHHLRMLVPGFKSLTVKARGGPGEVLAFWQEKGVQGDLSLADLSDGVLRLLCWLALCLHPHPPALICIDEPDQGVHPRTLPALAGLLQKASDRAQILLATHSSYFLAQFDLAQIAVFRKEDGQAVFVKPADSQALVDNLADFGADSLEIMHRSDELERLA